METEHVTSTVYIVYNFLTFKKIKKKQNNYILSHTEPGINANVIYLRTTPYAASFRRRFFAYHHTVNHPHINIILS